MESATPAQNKARIRDNLIVAGIALVVFLLGLALLFASSPRLNRAAQVPTTAASNATQR
jgi:uncharacterized membrane protein YjfL (UPF0719 family)